MEIGILERSIKNAWSENGTSNELSLQVMEAERFHPTAFTISPNPTPNVSVWLNVRIRKLFTYLFEKSQS